MRDRARQRLGPEAYTREVEIGRGLDVTVALDEADETFRSVEASALCLSRVTIVEPSEIAGQVRADHDLLEHPEAGA